MNRKVENVDRYFKENCKREVNVYKIAMETLNHKYIFHSFECMEYELRVQKLETCKFVIYGAGNIGKKVYLELSQKKLIPQCFVVTEKQGENELFGIPVLELAQLENNLEIIVAVSRGLQFDLIKNLIERGYTNYFRYPYSH